MVTETTSEQAESTEGSTDNRPNAVTFDRWAWLAPAVVAAGIFGYIWVKLPHAREDATLWQFIVKVVAFVLAIVAVSMFPRMRRGGYLLVCLAFVMFLGFIIPRMTYYFLMGPNNLPQYYTYLWSLDYPLIMLALTFAWRQAGGTVGTAMKIGLNGLVLVFSGFLEWMWFRANPSMDYYGMKTIPHIDVIIGHFPSYGGLFIYMLCHIPIFVALNIAPWDRWLDRLRTRFATKAATKAVPSSTQ
jgi:hypothetical protein